MQMNTIEFDELATTLEESQIHEIIDNGPLRTYVYTTNGQDVLIFESGGFVSVVYPCTALDAEFGGSIHTQARSIAAGD